MSATKHVTLWCDIEAEGCANHIQLAASNVSEAREEAANQGKRMYCWVTSRKGRTVIDICPKCRASIERQAAYRKAEAIANKENQTQQSVAEYTDDGIPLE